MNFHDFQIFRRETTPIADLFRYFQASPFKIAPEREKELERFRDENSIRIQLRIGDGGFEFKIGFDEEGLLIKNKLLVTNLVTLERIWAACYGFFVMQHLQTEKGGGAEISTPDGVKKLLSWALMESYKFEDLWPLDAPTPQTSVGFEREADELFLCVCGFLLLHEIGHHCRGDKFYESGVDAELLNHQMEFNADAWAYRHILDRWRSHKTDVKVMMKRAYGVGIALGLITALGMMGIVKLASERHPSSFERLKKFLQYLETAYGRGASIEIAAIKQNVACVLYAIGAEAIRKKGRGILEKQHEDADAVLAYLQSKFT